ncbi:MAG: hypothetical protein K8S94_02625 [Planctomycetia bacterium]|nr:hypothetical protein [Planctomycetia bacterium]
MLQKNPLQPPLPARLPCRPADAAHSMAQASPFVSAEDFDGTGILAGVDPCESLYWWMPELYGPGPAGRCDAAAAAAIAIQATRRTPSRSTAAA